MIHGAEVVYLCQIRVAGLFSNFGERNGFSSRLRLVGKHRARTYEVVQLLPHFTEVCLMCGTLFPLLLAHGGREGVLLSLQRIESALVLKLEDEDGNQKNRTQRT
jgi:hypothetical protein